MRRWHGPKGWYGSIAQLCLVKIAQCRQLCILWWSSRGLCMQKKKKKVAENKLVGNFLWLGSREDECRSVCGPFLAPVVRLMNAFWGGVDFLGGAIEKKTFVNAGDTRDMGSIPGLGGSPGGGNGNLLQYSCLENAMDRGAWRAAVHAVTKSRTRLSDWAHRVHRGGFA